LYKATRRFQKTRAETQKTKQFELVIAAHNAALLDPATDSKAHQRISKRLAKVQAEKETFEHALESRKTASELEWAEATFPGDLNLAELQSARADFGSSDAIRVYLDARISALDQQRQAEEQAVKDAEKRALELRNEIEWQACKKLERELNEQARPYFMAPRTIASRQHVMETFLQKASDARALAKERGDNAVDETGARQSIILVVYAETFELLAKRVDLFTYDLEWQMSDPDMEKLRWFWELPIDENWAFRGKEEQAQLRVALLRWRQKLGYSTDDIPYAPFPTKIPRNIGANPAILAGGELIRIPEQDRRAQIERKRLADLDDLRISDHKAWKKLDKESLKPLPIEDEISVYWVECRTLDNTRLPDVLYWPDGSRATRGQDIHFDSNSKNFYVEDIAVEWLGPSEHQQLNDADAEIANQKSVAGWMSEWNTHIIHKDTPTVPQQEAVKKATPFYRHIVKVLKADHMPDPSDKRHPRNGGQFRLGSFYTREQCDAADQQMAKQGLRIFDGVSRPPEQVTRTFRNEDKRHDSKVWNDWEEKQRLTGEEHESFSRR
jgi:hypothetical protein